MDDWLPPPPPEVRATLAHDPTARPCWCVRCVDTRRASMRRALSTVDGHMVDPTGNSGRWHAAQTPRSIR